MLRLNANGEGIYYNIKIADNLGLTAGDISINEDRKTVFPLELTLTEDGIVEWLRRHIIPKNRVHVDRILKALDLGSNDTKGIIDVCKGLSTTAIG